MTRGQPLPQGGLLPDAPELPPPVRVGRGGRKIPAEVIDDDGLGRFDPHIDGIDFWESLEGMRVQIENPLVVGPTGRFGNLVVVADQGADATGRTSRGGLLLRPGDGNPERLALDLTWLRDPFSAQVGDRFDGVVEGILDYQYRINRLRVQSILPPLRPVGDAAETTTLRSGAEKLTVATFNVYNLSAVSSQEHFDGLAATLVQRMGEPDVVALQEIQDDTGPVDDGVVTAEKTLRRLTESIQSVGGASYDSVQIDPEDNQDGGRPGSNIRVALLFRTDRVKIAGLDAEPGRRGVEVVRGARGPLLQPGYGRVEPAAAAFRAADSLGLGASRKPLAVQIEFGERTLFVINNHWTSKGPDTPLFGSSQPPRPISEHQRSQQALVVGRFVDQLLSVDPDAQVIVLGDLNDFEYRPPLRVVTGNRLVNLTERIPRDDRYTFIYNGNSQLLDHILVSRGVLEAATARIDIVHGNADSAIGNRSSDHDPVVVELDFGGAN